MRFLIALQLALRSLRLNILRTSLTVLGVVIGCILLGIVNTALAVLGISAFWQQAMYGVIILIALVVDKTVQNKASGQGVKK